VHTEAAGPAGQPPLVDETLTLASTGQRAR
jgi:hypothetical protein